MNSLGVTIQMEATEKYFAIKLLVFPVQCGTVPVQCGTVPVQCGLNFRGSVINR